MRLDGFDTRLRNVEVALAKVEQSLENPGAGRNPARHLYLVRRLDTLAQGMGELRERMAKLEGALDGFMAARQDHK